MRTFLLILFSLGIQTVADQNDQIIKELGNVKIDVENVKAEMKNGKVQVEDFKNQVSADMSKLGKALNEVLEILKTDGKDSSSKKDTSEKARVDPFPCFRSTKDSTCLDGIPIGRTPVDKALVRAKIGTSFKNVYVFAGDTGIG